MKKIFPICLLMVSVAMVGCASNPSGSDDRVAYSESSDADGEDLVCTREKPIGSNRIVKTCRTRAQVDADREASQDTMRDTQNRAPRTRSGDG